MALKLYEAGKTPTYGVCFTVCGITPVQGLEGTRWSDSERQRWIDGREGTRINPGYVEPRMHLTIIEWLVKFSTSAAALPNHSDHQLRNLFKSTSSA